MPTTPLSRDLQALITNGSDRSIAIAALNMVLELQTKVAALPTTVATSPVKPPEQTPVVATTTPAPVKPPAPQTPVVAATAPTPAPNVPAPAAPVSAVAAKAAPETAH